MSRPWSAALAALILTAPVQAGILVNGSAGHGWQPFSAPNENGIPYWDQQSLDGSQYNVGYYLTGTGGYASPAPVGVHSPGLPAADLQYWGSAGGGADLVQSFQTGGGGVGAKLLLTFAGNHEVNEFGWYSTDDPGTRYALFSGSDSYGTGPNLPVSVVFQPTGEFGFYLTTKDNVTYYSDSSLNPADDQNHQHFAVFRQSDGKLWLGVEEQVGDYNDMILSIQETPEPGGLALAGCGIVMLGLCYRYRRNVAANRDR